MKSVISFTLLAAVLFIPLASFGQKGSYAGVKQLQSPQNPAIGFIIHGGAGDIKKESLTLEKEKAYRVKLEGVVLAGYKALQEGKSAVDAVEIAVRMMEDSPLFNAGIGAIFTAEVKNDLDASIMDGKTLAAGGVAGLHHVKNPITLARAVMEKSPDVMLAGEGAEKFAKEQKIELVDKKESTVRNPQPALDQFGAFGAVALDRMGNLASGTSTGGMANKKYGSIGDAAIIGAATFANNNTCGVSGTGMGEFFIRLGVARDISALMEYRAMPVQAAADMVIKNKLQKLGSSGGVIAMDKFGNMAISFSTTGMYRAYINSDGKPVVEIY